MTRKLALLLTVCLGCSHGVVHALGLGEIEVDSALNQRFDARIELRNTEALGPNEIIAGLASADDFARVGVERFFFLSDLQFRTDLSDPANPTILVTSSQPVTEPFVNFVVEVMWPSGRLLREYTVLLDPANFAPTPVTPAGTSPSAGPGDRERSAAPAAPARETTTDPAAARPAPETGGRGEFSGSSYGVTDREDTLWEVALTVRPDASLSVQQTMLALVRLNPEAFIGSNVNQLKAGYVLRVPDAAEIRRLSFDDAVMQVAQQNDRWRRGLDREPLDARDATGTAGSGASASDGELRLVAAEDSAASGAREGSARGTSGQAADDDTAAGAQGASAAELAEARASAEALRDQLAATEERAAELARELELKNEQLARAQEVLARQMEETPAPAPLPAASGGLFGLSWLVIAAGLAALVVAVAAVLLVLRRRGDDGEAMGPVRQRTGAEANGPVAPFLGPSTADDDRDDVAPAPGDESDEAEDVIGEADVYMVYGRFSEAARVLNAAIDQDPDRADLRLKLLEVYVESGDVDGFNEQAQALSAFADGDTIALADQLATRLPGAMSSSGEVTDGVVSSAPSADATDGEVSLDFDLATAERGAPLDLDSLDIDLDVDEPRAGDRAAPGAAGPDPDFDLDVSAEDEVDLEADGDLADIDYALDLDDDGNAPAADHRATAATDGGSDADADADADAGADVDRDEEEDLFADIEFDRPEGAAQDADSGVRGDEGVAARNDDGFEKTQLLDSTAIARALAADSEDSATAGTPGDEVPDDEFAFDIEDLDPDAVADAEADAVRDADADARAQASPASGDFSIDDLAEPPAATAADETSTPGAPADGGAVPLQADEDRTLLATADDDLDFDLDGDEFDFDSAEQGDEVSTKLDLARAYVDMGDEDGAKEILGEVVRDGDDAQKREADDLLQQLG